MSRMLVVEAARGSARSARKMARLPQGKYLPLPERFEGPGYSC